MAVDGETNNNKRLQGVGKIKSQWPLKQVLGQ
jgi:hypothetical protein